jgi:hypothetical protein
VTRALRRAALLGALLTLGTAPGAPAAILAQEDAAELANALAEATFEQKVCYGWAFQVADNWTGEEDGPEVGSNFGPGTPVDPARPECAEGVVVLAGSITYTSETSESEDSAAWEIQSTLPDPPRIEQLEDLGYSSGDLLGDENDLAIINPTGALPSLVAERGVAAPIPFETPAREPGVGGEPTNSPSSDFLRQNGSLLAICALLFVGGLVWLVHQLRHGRPGTPRSRPAEG